MNEVGYENKGNFDEHRDAAAGDDIGLTSLGGAEGAI